MLDHLFLAMILAQIQPLEDVTVPWLQVHGKCPFTLSAPLIHIPAKHHEVVLQPPINMHQLDLHFEPF